MSDTGVAESEYTTRGLAAVAGCSVQQVRDLERLGVIPPALRRPNGYRQFGAVHVIALRGYRRLAQAVGPVVARSTMTELNALPHDEAIGRIVALHVVLARSRDDALAALAALDRIAEEPGREAAVTPADTLSITELAAALDVRSSTLRFWEDCGVIAPTRSGANRVRSYPPDAVRVARIVAALRSGGYGIPAVREVIAALRTVDGAGDARGALEGRLRDIAGRSESLLRAGADLVELLRHAPGSLGKADG